MYIILGTEVMAEIRGSTCKISATWKNHYCSSLHVLENNTCVLKFDEDHLYIYTSRNPQQCCGDHDLILFIMPFQSVQCHYQYTKPYCNWLDWLIIYI